MQRFRRSIAGVNLPFWVFGLEGFGYATAACARVHNTCVLRQVGQGQNHADKLLCLRTRNQHRRIDADRMAAETAMTYDMLYRLIVQEPADSEVKFLPLLHAESRADACHNVREGQIKIILNNYSCQCLSFTIAEVARKSADDMMKKVMRRCLRCWHCAL